MITVGFMNELMFMLIGIVIGNIGKIVKLIVKVITLSWKVKRYESNS